MVFEKTLERVPCTARRSNQSILKEISPWCSLEGLMLKLKLQYFGHLMRRIDSLGKTPILGRLKVGEGDDRGWNGWMASPTQWTWVLVNSASWWWTRRPGVLLSIGVAESDTTEWLNWTELNWIYYFSERPNIYFPILYFKQGLYLKDISFCLYITNRKLNLARSTTCTGIHSKYGLGLMFISKSVLFLFYNKIYIPYR